MECPIKTIWSTNATNMAELIWIDFTSDSDIKYYE